MDNCAKLVAPKPVKMNPFLKRGVSKQSIKEKRAIYRNSDRVKSENIFSNPSRSDIFFDEDVERDFDEMEAKSEILSILQNDNSLASSLATRVSAMSVSTFDAFDPHEENPFSKNEEGNIHKNDVNC